MGTLLSNKVGAGQQALTQILRKGLRATNAFIAGFFNCYSGGRQTCFRDHKQLLTLEIYYYILFHSEPGSPYICESSVVLPLRATKCSSYLSVVLPLIAARLLFKCMFPLSCNKVSFCFLYLRMWSEPGPLITSTGLFYFYSGQAYSLPGLLTAIWSFLTHGFLYPWLFYHFHLLLAMAQVQPDLHKTERDYQLIEESKIPTMRWSGEAVDTRYVDAVTECCMEVLCSALASTLQGSVLNWDVCV